MKTRESFLEMLASAKESDIKYIGTGNPDAKILIIGKESSLDATKPENKGHMDLLNKNIDLWDRDKEKSIDQISDWNNDNFSPMYPYKYQKHRINDGSNLGTSKTWYNYQKIHNHIFGKSDVVNFHENIFTTEVNSTPSPKNKDADTSSIKKRKEFISKSKFFKKFPIIIIDGVGYFEIAENKNEIEKIFDVTFVKNIGDKKSQPIWVHKGNDFPRLLMNTYQMSINVSNERLKRMGDLIKLFLENPNKAFESIE